MGLITPGKNPFFEHAVAQLYLADARRQGRRPYLRLDRQGVDAACRPTRVADLDSGNWGYLDAEDRGASLALLIAQGRGVAAYRAGRAQRALGPVSMSIWEEPGLLIKGHDHPPTVMMGHDDPRYEAWVEAAGYAKVKDLHTWDLDITRPFPTR